MIVDDHLDGALADDLPPWFALASHCLVCTVRSAGSIADAALRTVSRPKGTKTTDT